jgi:Family of unknown function (DUF6516)
MAKAELFYRDRMDWRDGHIVEMTICRLPTSSIERPRSLKYSLFYGRRGERIVGYDNEAGKGDHRHYRGHEESNIFTDVETLIAEFLNDVRMERGET